MQTEYCLSRLSIACAQRQVVPYYESNLCQRVASMAGCPFMAIYEATKEKNGTPASLTCPFSGRRTPVSTAVQISGHSFGTHNEDETWHQTSHLSAIREDAELDFRELSVKGSSTEDSNHDQKDENSPRHSRTGSFSSKQASSHKGSLTSGIQTHIPGSGPLKQLEIVQCLQKLLTMKFFPNDLDSDVSFCN